MIVYGWSRVTARARSASSSGSRPRPRSRSSASDDAGLGVARDPLALLGRVSRVDRDCDRARARDPEVDVRPLGAGCTEDRYAVAGLDAEVDQAAAHLGDDVAQLGIADVLPGAVLLVPDRRSVAVAHGGQPDQVGDRRRTGRPFMGLDRGAALHGSSSRSQRRPILCGLTLSQAGTALAVAVGLAACSERLARNKVLSMRPWKMGTPISMHFSITSRRSKPASRASSVGVRWIAIGLATSRAVCHVHRKVAKLPDALNRIYSIWGKHRGGPRSDRVRDVDPEVLDTEALGEPVAQAVDPERLGRVVAGGDEVDARLARVRHDVLLRLAGDEGVVALGDRAVE